MELTVVLRDLHVADRNVAELLCELTIALDIREKFRRGARGDAVGEDMLVRPKRILAGDDVFMVGRNAVDIQQRNLSAANAGKRRIRNCARR